MGATSAGAYPRDGWVQSLILTQNTPFFSAQEPSSVLASCLCLRHRVIVVPRPDCRFLLCIVLSHVLTAIHHDLFSCRLNPIKLLPQLLLLLLLRLLLLRLLLLLLPLLLLLLLVFFRPQPQSFA